MNHNNIHSGIEETLSSNSNINIQSKVSKVVKYVYHLIEIFIMFIISYCNSISVLFESYKFIMGEI